MLEDIELIVHDGEVAQHVVDAAGISMGKDLKEIDT